VHRAVRPEISLAKSSTPPLSINAINIAREQFVFDIGHGRICTIRQYDV